MFRIYDGYDLASSAEIFTTLKKVGKARFLFSFIKKGDEETKRRVILIIAYTRATINTTTNINSTTSRIKI